MKRIIALCVASSISIALQAYEGPGTTESQIADPEASWKAWEAEKKKTIEALEAEHAHLGELERLAVPIGVFGGASREQLLPYRFSDASKLQSMLSDPKWKNNWRKIAAAIAMVADKKVALELIEFIKNSEAPGGYVDDWNEARSTAIAALGYTLIDQDIPEVLEFIEKLTDDSYAESLSMKALSTPQIQAYGALYLAATDDAVALLERLLSKKMEEKENQTIQALSVGGKSKEQHEEKTNKQIRMIKMFLDDVKRDRAGISPEPSDEMP